MACVYSRLDDPLPATAFSYSLSAPVADYGAPKNREDESAPSHETDRLTRAGRRFVFSPSQRGLATRWESTPSLTRALLDKRRRCI